MQNKHAVVIGNYTRVKYHPLKGVDEELTAIFQKHITLSCTEDQDVLMADKIKHYAFCLSYTDCWDYKVEKAQIAGLLAYVCNGGGLLVIHSGISLQNHFEFTQVIGAKFIGHPEMKVLEFKITGQEHPIVKGMSNFSVYEEPYQFELSFFSERKELLEYNLNGKKVPAGWALEFGLGRVVYLMIGHTRDSFLNPTYREIILRSGQWCAGEL